MLNSFLLCVNRLQQELMGIMMGADPGASAFPNDDNLFEWTATLSGSEDTAVRGVLSVGVQILTPCSEECGGGRGGDTAFGESV